MNKKIQSSLFVAMLFAAIPATAQTSQDAPASQLKMLLQLKGFWEAKTAIIKMGDKENTIPYYANFKTTADNNGLLMNEWATIPGLGKLNGTNLVGVNPFDGKVHWFSVDNMGTAHEHIGAFSDARHFLMVYKEMQDDKEFQETVAMELISRDEMKLNITAMLDGKEIETISATFQRKPDKENN
jgi:hypothetical protein